ncbi:MAG: DUF1826 domain-containing protein [Pseudomonadota bacterium]
MSATISNLPVGSNTANPTKALRRTAAKGTTVDVLADVYDERNNIVIWQRPISDDLDSAISAFLGETQALEATLVVTPGHVEEQIRLATGKTLPETLARDLSDLVEKFCFLFELERAGMRLATLDRAMCPRFHVDRVPCRLITTYSGIGTEWLSHDAVDRSKLGPGSNGLADHESGIYGDDNDINRLARGEVALLKGELWPENEGAGLVHRSPAVAPGEQRLLLTLDMAD